jgi:hypothetical protein
MPSAGFEPATAATKRPQTYALDRAATEVGRIIFRFLFISEMLILMISKTERYCSIKMFLLLKCVTLHKNQRQG